MAIERKNTFFVVSVIFSFITFYAQYRPTVIHFPLDSRIANALVSFVTYLGKTFRPHDLAVIYPFVEQIPFGQVMGAVLLIIVISAAVIVTAKNHHVFFWNEAICQKPDYAEAYYNRGTIYAMLGRYQLAIEDFKKVILLKPDFKEAYQSLQLVLVRQQQKR